VNWAKDLNDIRTKETFYPRLDKRDLIPLGFIAERSGHSCGSTVDLTLAEKETCEEIDMGGSFDFFGESSRSDYTGITKEQRENRILLRKTMIRHGFMPLSEEWWHFTLEKEPYPDTYFDFPVSSNSLKQQKKNGHKSSAGKKI
jgi:D-alanyl-D-alanine dipeptidase